MATPEDIANAFVKHYYTLMDGGARSNLGPLYLNQSIAGETGQFDDQFVSIYNKKTHKKYLPLAPQSILTFEGNRFEGRDPIAAKLVSLPFQKIQHVITTVDVQPIANVGMLLVFVIGQLKTDDDKPHGFSQTFVLKSETEGIFVVNDTFRLSLHHQ